MPTRFLQTIRDGSIAKRISGYNAFESDRRLGASQLESEAEVGASPERQLRVRPAGYIESVRIGEFCRIAVRRSRMQKSSLRA